MPKKITTPHRFPHRLSQSLTARLGPLKPDFSGIFLARPIRSLHFYASFPCFISNLPCTFEVRFSSFLIVSHRFSSLFILSYRFLSASIVNIASLGLSYLLDSHSDDPDVIPET
jgi:hypothetical protein